MSKRIGFILVLLLLSVSLFECSSLNNKSVKKMTGESKNWSDIKVQEQQFIEGNSVEFYVSSKVKSGTLTIRLLGADDRDIINFDSNSTMTIVHSFKETEDCKLEIIGVEFNGKFNVKWSIIES